MSKRRIGAEKWNGYIRQGKDAVELLRDDIEELRAANQENLDVLNFLITMLNRLDKITDSFNGIWEIGVQYKEFRINGDNDDG